MPTFERGQSIRTAQAEIVVDAGLRPGVHRFRLVVVNGRGRESVPDEVVVEVTEGRVPAQPIVAIGPGAPGGARKRVPSRASRSKP